MKSISMLTLAAIFLTGILHSQELPYKGGENQLLQDFFDYYYLSKKSRTDKCLGSFKDSAGIYFIEISYSADSKKVSAKLYGSAGNDDMTIIIHQFFEQTINNWNRRQVRKRRVIIPVQIAETAAMQAESVYIDLVQLARSNMLLSGPCYFMKPIIRTFFCNPPDEE